MPPLVRWYLRHCFLYFLLPPPAFSSCLPNSPHLCSWCLLPLYISCLLCPLFRGLTIAFLPLHPPLSPSSLSSPWIILLPFLYLSSFLFPVFFFLFPHSFFILTFSFYQTAFPFLSASFQISFLSVHCS